MANVLSVSSNDEFSGILRGHFGLKVMVINILSANQYVQGQGEPTKPEEKRANSLHNSIRSMLERVGLTLNHFNGAPRGYAVYIDLPDGSYNTFGGREHGHGIG